MFFGKLFCVLAYVYCVSAASYNIVTGEFLMAIVFIVFAFICYSFSAHIYKQIIEDFHKFIDK